MHSSKLVTPSCSILFSLRQIIVAVVHVRSGILVISIQLGDEMELIWTKMHSVPNSSGCEYKKVFIYYMPTAVSLQLSRSTSDEWHFIKECAR